jgi:tetratricopeptide (TPR) repeat protein
VTERQPFIGERAYREADAHLFFGRSVETRQARALWLEHRMVVMHGPEASGKTSLLHAGVLPSLDPGVANLLPVGRVGPGSRLGQGQPVASPVGTLIRSWTRDGQSRPRAGMTIQDFLAERRAVGDQGKSRPLLAAIDQFEECLAPAIERSDQDRLMGELFAALDAIPELHVLLVIRQDFIPVLARQQMFTDIQSRYFPLPPFESGIAAVALEKAANISGISLASGVTDQLVSDLSTMTFQDLAGNTATIVRNQVEPLQLQVTGRSLWASLPPTAQVITGEQLQSWGGADRALIAFYDSAVKDAAAESGIEESRLHDWIRRTFVTELGTRGSVRDIQVVISGIIAEAADYLVGRRVLSTEYHDGILWYQLSHDRLASVVLASNGNRKRMQGPGAPGNEEPSTAHGMRAMARAAFNKGNLPAARQHAEEAIARYQAEDDWRGIADTRLVEADIARVAGDLLSAEQHLRSALSVFLMLEDGYSAARALTALADLRFAVGDYAAAADLNRQAVERMPGDVTALTGLGYAQWQAGSPADAEATFSQVLRRESNAAMALVGRGQIRADLGRYDSALSDLDRALQSPLGRDIEADARSARALALAGLGRVVEARRELTASFQIDSDRPRSRLRAGRIAAILGERNEMRAEIERALSGRRPSLSSVERDSANRLLDSLR